MSYIQLNAFAAEQAKQEGMERAAKSANRKNDGWIDKAYAYTVQWLYQQVPKHKFMTEEVRAAAAKFGIPEPPDNRAWGNIVVMAKGDKLIKHVGWVATTNKKAHRTPAALWQKL